jgi:hypothetical protein
MSQSKISKIFNACVAAMVLAGILAGGFWLNRWIQERRTLQKMVDRLSADSRTAEVLVTKSELDEKSGAILTTIKFLEFDADGKPLIPKYFSFRGNVIQFQSLVIRFQDKLVRAGDRLKGKSAYLFMKVFVLDGARTQEFEINKIHEVPEGYRVSSPRPEFETRMWSSFWKYALNPQARERMGIKNAQIEAPGTLFLPGTLYTLRIEHDGGLRIDTRPIPEILKGEKI